MHKSKGFQLKSGNKAKAPFKMMGSSPAKEDLIKIDPIQTKEIKQTKLSPPDKLEGSTKTFKEIKAEDKALDKSDTMFKDTKGDGTVVSRTAKKIGKGIKEGVKKTKEYIKENPQAIRDMGAVISNIGDPNTSMSSVIQGQADRKQERADKDIQNEKDKVSTERTQQLVDTYKKENSGEAELPEDDSKAATNIKGSTMTNLSKNK